MVKITEKLCLFRKFTPNHLYQKIEFERADDEWKLFYISINKISKRWTSNRTDKIIDLVQHYTFDS